MAVEAVVIGVLGRALVGAMTRSLALRAIGRWLVGFADILWEASAAFLGASIALSVRLM